MVEEEEEDADDDDDGTEGDGELVLSVSAAAVEGAGAATAVEKLERASCCGCCATDGSGYQVNETEPGSGDSCASDRKPDTMGMAALAAAATNSSMALPLLLRGLGDASSDDVGEGAGEGDDGSMGVTISTCSSKKCTCGKAASGVSRCGIDDAVPEAVGDDEKLAVDDATVAMMMVVSSSSSDSGVARKLST
mgnify:CR=1 FL=1